jgi:hypothetical protein
MNNCSIWYISDGYFSPFKLIPTKNSELLASTIRKINIPVNISIYLRGSFLESDFLFPNSDIDLVAISDNISKDFLEALKTKLENFKRPIEILSLGQSETQKRHSLRLLLHTRSLHIAGPKIKFSPVKADLETMQDHYFQYKPHMIPANLSLNKNIRIMQLKQITRAYGILYFMHNSKVFSRDISTCLNWAIELDNKTGSILKDLWDSVDYPRTYKKYLLSEIKSAFLNESKRAINIFKENERFTPYHNSALASN